MEHPCDGCEWFYAVYAVNRCCNYLLDTGRRRPCPPGKGCTVKRGRGEMGRKGGGHIPF